ASTRTSKNTCVSGGSVAMTGSNKLGLTWVWGGSWPAIQGEASALARHGHAASRDAGVFAGAG
ncbi:MAG: hypothetical protein AAFX99_30660, partial [Myxococcota bacterium]